MTYDHLWKNIRPGSRLLKSLQQSPWPWPNPAEHPAIFGNACKRTHLPGPPQLAIGDTPLLTANGYQGSLWKLSALQPAYSQAVPFNTEAQKAWQFAMLALPKAAPLIWKSLSTHRQCPSGATRLASTSTNTQYTTQFENSLDGSSFGLSFALALASIAFNEPLPPDIAATAAIDADGNLLAIDGLHEKISVLIQYAPAIRRLFVHKSQMEEAERLAAGTHLEIIGIVHLHHALPTVFENLDKLILRNGSNHAARAQIVDSIFDLILSGGSALSAWRPVQNAALKALNDWPDLTESQQHKLRFAAASAARHFNNERPRQFELTMPPETWFQEIPQPKRLDCLANYVQNMSDTGHPSEHLVLPIAQKHLVRGNDAFPAHLRLLGSLARFYSATNRLQDALKMQQEAAHGWWLRGQINEISYPLSEWFRLIGLLETSSTDHASLLAEADQLFARVEHDPALGTTDYIQLARATTYLRCNIPAAFILPTLEKLCAPPTDKNLRAAATRWLVFAHDHNNHTEKAQAAIQRLHPGGDIHAVANERSQITLQLIQLDRAIRNNDHPTAHQALKSILSLEPEPSQKILHTSACPPELHPQHLQRHYPY